MYTSPPNSHGRSPGPAIEHQSKRPTSPKDDDEEEEDESSEEDLQDRDATLLQGAETEEETEEETEDESEEEATEEDTGEDDGSDTEVGFNTFPTCNISHPNPMNRFFVHPRTHTGG